MKYSSLELADRQSLKLREVCCKCAVNVRTLVMDIYDSSQSRVHVFRCWRWRCDWDREGWVSATGAWLMSRLAAPLVFSRCGAPCSPWPVVTAAPGSGTEEFMARAPGQWGLVWRQAEAHTCLSSKLSRRWTNKKQRKRTIRYFLPSRSNEPWMSQCLLMCDFQIIEISILSSPMPIMALCPEIINVVASSVDTLCNALWGRFSLYT